MNKPINLAAARPLVLSGPTPETVQAEMLARVNQTHEMTGEMVALLQKRWDESLVMARAQEIARAKRNDIWIGLAGLTLGACMAFAAFALVGGVMGRQATEAVANGVVLGRAEANQEALEEAAAVPADDKGYRRTPDGWRQK